MIGIAASCLGVRCLRETPDPYRVWLSEIMLQQTTVKTVAPYFSRFMERWPDVRALAAAPLDDVLKLWAGLGYYARARNLHACARVVVEDHGGRFPAGAAALAALPGIGRYTASAIAAIAFGERTVPVDGNVERVVARIFAVASELPGAKLELWRLAQTLTPPLATGRFRAGAHGSWRHHLHAETAGLSAVSMDGGLCGARAGRTGTLSGESTQAGRALAARRGLCRRAC